jgi:hypothetical protein
LWRNSQKKNQIRLLTLSLSGLQIFPFRQSNARLSENLPEEVLSDVFSMRVRDTKSLISSHHELMLSTRIWTDKTELSQVMDEVPASNRSESGHQATS